MRNDRQLSIDPTRSWFTMDQLLDSMLADAVSADANFQLMQGAAWRQFGDSLQRSGAASSIDSVDLAESFGRLSNLGMQQLELTLSLELYRPGWWTRLGWFISGLFGQRPEPQPALYRMAIGRNSAAVQLKVQAVRNRQGHWQTDADPEQTQADVA
ncbi:MAG: hypothetical protein V7752_15480 [Halopseudomonas sp.]